MKLILAATDFSTAAAAAMRRAAQVAAASGARLALLHVAPHRSAWARIANAVLPWATLQREAARVRMEYGIPVEVFVAKGAAHKEIAAFARTARADLVVLGLRDGFMQDLLGNATVQRVRRRLAVPVLAVPREPRRAYRRMLVATNLSEASVRAAVLAARTFPDAEIHLLHVCRPPFEGRLAMSGTSESAREEHRRRAVLDAMRNVSAFGARTGLARASIGVRVGSPVTGILEHAAQIGADLLVVAPAEKSWLEKLILASVTDVLLSHADRDVLIIEPTGRNSRAAANPDFRSWRVPRPEA
jgi:nucleotide-binding universal stress UspA family protein